MRNVRLALIATTALTLAGGAAVAQTQYPSTTQDRLGAVVGALFGDRLGPVSYTHLTLPTNREV